MSLDTDGNVYYHVDYRNNDYTLTFEAALLSAVELTENSNAFYARREQDRAERLQREEEEQRQREAVEKIYAEQRAKEEEQRAETREARIEAAKEICKNCRFFYDHPIGDLDGQCRRHAPRPQEVTEPEWLWPDVQGETVTELDRLRRESVAMMALYEIKSQLDRISIKPPEDEKPKADAPPRP